METIAPGDGIGPHIEQDLDAMPQQEIEESIHLPPFVTGGVDLAFPRRRPDGPLLDPVALQRVPRVLGVRRLDQGRGREPAVAAIDPVDGLGNTGLKGPGPAAGVAARTQETPGGDRDGAGLRQPIEFVIEGEGKRPEPVRHELVDRSGGLDVLGKALGRENCFAGIKGHVAAGPMTFAKISTDDGRGTVKAYVGEGRFTGESTGMQGGIAVCEVDNLQKLLDYMCQHGFEHHVAMNRGQVADVLAEAFGSTWDGRCIGTGEPADTKMCQEVWK